MKRSWWLDQKVLHTIKSIREAILHKIKDFLWSHFKNLFLWRMASLGQKYQIWNVKMRDLCEIPAVECEVGAEWCGITTWPFTRCNSNYDCMWVSWKRNTFYISCQILVYTSTPTWSVTVKKTPACTMSSAPDQRAMWGTTLEPGDDVVFKCLRTLGTGTGG